MNINIISGSEKLIGKKIRYIKYEDTNYFIFTLSEIDEEGYEKLYINKITDNSDDIILDQEWENLKKVIPTIVKQIKSDIISDFDDLSLKEVEEVDLMYSKPFKLKSNIVKLIIKEENLEKIDEQLESLVDDVELEDKNMDDLEAFLNNYEEELNKIEIPIRPDEEKNESLDEIKEELIQEKYKNSELTKKVNELEKLVDEYKEKIERIKIMLEA